MDSDSRSSSFSDVFSSDGSNGAGARRLTNANFPRDAEERVYHLACKHGDLANRIITVGDPKRAQMLCGLLDPGFAVHTVASTRGFTVYSGTFNKVPVSVVATGMGRPMMDFLVRESRAVVEGPMLFIRLGSAGTVREDVACGSVAVASLGAAEVVQNSMAFHTAPGASRSEPDYRVSGVILPDVLLTASLAEHLRTHVSPEQVVEGINITADSFYSSQGRIDPSFEDRNETLLHDLVAAFPTAVALEMETFQLFHLARLCRPVGSIRAAAAAIIFANRRTNEFIDPLLAKQREQAAGRAVLETITAMPLGTTSTLT